VIGEDAKAIAGGAKRSNSLQGRCNFGVFPAVGPRRDREDLFDG